jgi:hypothetical protein
MNFANVPAALRERDQWVLWKNLSRDGEPTKVPVRADGGTAKSTDPTTWASFDRVRTAFDPAEHAGIGFVFAATDPFVGVDLDGCRDPETGRVAEWAREIVLKFGTYAEVSPSNTGVKLFARGKSPFDRGRKFELPDVERVCTKAPAVEIYDRGRYFAVTGLRLAGPGEPTEAAGALDWLKNKYQPVEAPRPVIDFNSPAAILDRARKYLAKLPVAVSGQGGHNATFRAACVLVLGFELSEADATGLLLTWNSGCLPPWPTREIERKVREAAKQSGPRGYLRNARPDSWAQITVPEYTAPAPKPAPRTTTPAKASLQFIDSLRHGAPPLASTSVSELNYALEGGIGFGEMAIGAARPGHCKSAFALQCVHHWTAKCVPNSAPAVIISEEMSALMLGKRTVQHVTDLDPARWGGSIERLEGELKTYAEKRHDCFIVESCGTAAAAVEAVERHVEEHGCRFAVIDYAQLLKSPGNGRYEQVTNTSIALRQLASRTKVALLVLCQLSRGVEQRGGQFLPIMSDLKDSGQLEQDADVIIFQVWPFRLNPAEPRERYQFFVMKNRNRAIRRSVVECRLEPERQRISDHGPTVRADSSTPFGEVSDL